MGKDERKSEFPKFDGRLRDAVTDDMAAYVGEVMSSVAFRGGRRGVHSVRTVQELSTFGWSEVRYPYRRGADDGLDFRRAFGIKRKMTPCASETVSRLAVQLGSFKETRDALAPLGCGRMSVSKVRDETLVTGGRMLDEQRRPQKDVRRYTEAQTRTPEGGKAVRRTLVAMADGTNAPCVKKDTKGVRGKDGDEAHSRQLRVMNFFEYCNGEHALRMAAQERLLHLLVTRRGGREDSRRTPVQAGRDALAPPQRRMRLRHHRQAALRSMRTAAMDAYFFNELKSHPRVRPNWHTVSGTPCQNANSAPAANPVRNHYTPYICSEQIAVIEKLLPRRRTADDIAMRADGDLIRQLAFSGQVSRQDIVRKRRFAVRSRHERGNDGRKPHDGKRVEEIRADDVSEDELVFTAPPRRRRTHRSTRPMRKGRRT